jgi:hypothetical protein
LFTPITPQGHFYILALTTFTALAIRLSLPVPGISWQPSTFGFRIQQRFFQTQQFFY